MPMNHLSPDIPGAVWWTQQQQPPMMEPPPKTPSSKHQPLLLSPPPPPNTLWTNTQFYDLHHHRATASATPSSAFGFNLNQEDDDDEQLADERQNPEKGQFEEEQSEADKEPMFEKPLTPSDVGKLNRLVIPKQHAEKYFPLGGGGGGDSGEKGLLLSFEDESGKCWRFRYSYWNSSQSYVLTKGWSRFVKEKRLDAGDVVLFERHRVDGDRLFIGWRRRSASTGQDSGVAQPAAVAAASSGGGGRGGWTRVYYSAHSYPSHPPPHGPPIPYQPDCLHAGAVVQNQTIPSGNSKRLRLFGVNLECQTDGSEPSTPDGSSMSSQGLVHSQYSTINAPASNPQIDNMDINFFTRDVNQMRYDHHG